MTKRKDKALVVFSGGQDSTTCLYWAMRRFGPENVSAVTFDYGHRHKIEIQSAQRIARLAGIPHQILSISTFRELGGSSLTSALAVSHRRGRRGLPNTFVPGRNLIFLTFAAAYAYPAGIRHLVAGVCQADVAGYPDCRRNTIRALEKSLCLGMDFPFRIHTPLIRLSKPDTVRLAVRLQALPALALSHTCYNGKRPPCGKCMACRLRADAFAEAGIPDPLLSR
ncbi:MAG: 7-cyano-7-deazaguanine synthase QueC [Elusimicrobia bacterium RIFOXYB2_FULL_49_7]|nr:MAG: 7-cyano-7-deazaguanine synthase QueC [Elusimicrobia bacterium RIFOXYB2_FULL_49_7]